MHVQISKKCLIAAVRSVLPVAGTRSTLPILSGIKIDASMAGLSLEATDLEAAARVVVPEATVSEHGAIVVPAKPLSKALAAMTDDDVTLEVQEAGVDRPQLKLTSGSRTIAFDGWTTKDWPTTQIPGDGRAIASVPAAALADAFERTALCASGDEARPILTGLALHFTRNPDRLEVVATDSYRLGIVAISLAEPPNVADVMPIIPARVAFALAKQMKKQGGEVRIGTLRQGGSGSQRIVFGFGHATWIVRSIEGDFPNWQQLTPAPSGAQVSFDTSELASALKAVDAVRSNGTPVRLSLGDSCSLTLVEHDNATLTESLSAATFSPDGVGAIDVAFNPRFLADAIRFLGGDRIDMWVRDSLKPALLGTPECRYLLMPVRTS